eukprot:301366_1
MEGKTQSIHSEPMDIVPLAINNKNEDSENGDDALRVHAAGNDIKIESHRFSLPPLPIVASNEPSNDVHTQTQVPPYPNTQHYASPSPKSRGSSRQRRMMMPVHLRPPPPLTPMSSIAYDGSVIGEEVQNKENEYWMPPPPPPPYDYESGRRDVKKVRNAQRRVVNHVIEPSGRRLKFHCNVCGRSFGAKQHFEYHMRTHSGEKPFKCETCGKPFRAKHSLKNHIRIHTGERPYQCNFCGRWFRQLGVMKNHIRNIHSHQ